ncbi:MAG: site-2 protease family protein [Anaerolineales bacterium]|jgi:Zn-dependent protease
MLGLSPTDLIARLITLVVALSVHEFAHAWTADQLGDDTPRLQGRLTLNPLAHLDPLGSLMLVLVGFGWARPVVVNPYQLQRRSPAAMMLVAVAGPFSNLLMAIIAAIPFRAGLLSLGFSPSFTAELLAQFIFINLLLMFFNLIPISPLDGEKVADYFLPPGGQRFLDRIRPYGPFLLLALIFLGSFGGLDLLGNLVGKPALSIFRLLIT